MINMILGMWDCQDHRSKVHDFDCLLHVGVLVVVVPFELDLLR